MEAERLQMVEQLVPQVVDHALAGVDLHLRAVRGHELIDDLQRDARDDDGNQQLVRAAVRHAVDERLDAAAGTARRRWRDRSTPAPTAASRPARISASIRTASSVTRPRCGRRNDSIHGTSGLFVSADGMTAGSRSCQPIFRPAPRGVVTGTVARRARAERSGGDVERHDRVDCWRRRRTAIRCPARTRRATARRT